METTMINQIVPLLKAKNIPFEVGNDSIGIRTGKYVWHWFDQSITGQVLFFNHSYSQNTGSSKSGFRRGMRVKMAISKKIGFEI
jgi:hypothetical protein